MLRISIRRFVLVLAIAAGALRTSDADDSEVGPNPDALWQIVHNCIDSDNGGDPKQCARPRESNVATSDPRCASTTQVWAQNSEYVAIRDQKMCGCDDTFVHGLAIPFKRIIGIEASELPEGIWEFAWNAAETRISDPSAIALVVSPPLARSQNQLHVHLVRLLPNARSKFRVGSVVHIPNLDHIWSVAKITAGQSQLKNYGLLVAKSLDGVGFTLLVQEFVGRDSPGSEYTEDRCPAVR